MTLKNQENNAQLCENEEEKDETNDRSQKISNKKEPKTPIEFYDVYS